MGRSAKVTRTVGLRQIKRSAKGIDKPSKMAARRRKEKSDKIKEAIDREADIAPGEYVIKCRFQSKRALRYIRLQLFPSTFR